MLACIQKHPDGILMDDVVDAYAAASTDAEALVAAGEVRPCLVGTLLAWLNTLG